MKFLLICLILLAPAIHAKEVDYNKLVNAIYRAEGGDKSRHPYGILSVKVRNKAEARRVCLNTVRNNHKRWIKAGRKGDYLAFLARRYCPVGAANDPKGLNRHWLGNVRRIYYAT